jgi:hypothetical protein
VKIALLSFFAVLSFAQSSQAGCLVDGEGKILELGPAKFVLAENIPLNLIPAIENAIKAANVNAGREIFALDKVLTFEDGFGMNGQNEIILGKLDNQKISQWAAYFTHGKIHEIDITLNNVDFNLTPMHVESSLTKDLTRLVCPK